MTASVFERKDKYCKSRRPTFNYNALHDVIDFTLNYGH